MGSLPPVTSPCASSLLSRAATPGRPRVSLAQGGPGLGTVWGTQRDLRMLADAGFTRVSVEDVPQDILNHYYIAM